MTNLHKMTCAQLRRKTRTSISRKICYVKTGFQILYAVEQFIHTGFLRSLTDGYAMLMIPIKNETAVHGCHCSRDMAVRMREVMARPLVGVCVPLASIYW